METLCDECDVAGSCKFVAGAHHCQALARLASMSQVQAIWVAASVTLRMRLRLEGDGTAAQGDGGAGLVDVFGGQAFQIMIHHDDVGQ